MELGRKYCRILSKSIINVGENPGFLTNKRFVQITWQVCPPPSVARRAQTSWPQSATFRSRNDFQPEKKIVLETVTVPATVPAIPYFRHPSAGAKQDSRRSTNSTPDTPTVRARHPAAVPAAPLARPVFRKAASPDRPSRSRLAPARAKSSILIPLKVGHSDQMFSGSGRQSLNAFQMP